MKEQEVLLGKGSYKFALYVCLRYIAIGKLREKGHLTY